MLGWSSDGGGCWAGHLVIRWRGGSSDGCVGQSIWSSDGGMGHQMEGCVGLVISWRDVLGCLSGHQMEGCVGLVIRWRGGSSDGGVGRQMGVLGWSSDGGVSHQMEGCVGLSIQSYSSYRLP